MATKNPGTIQTAWLAVATLLLSIPCQAGTVISFECSDANSTYKDKWDVGGRFSAASVTGFCTSTNRLVTLWWPTSWRIGEKEPLPPERVHVVDPDTGKTISMYHSPDCNEPFVPIETEEQLLRIPPCQGKDFKVTGEMDVD